MLPACICLTLWRVLVDPAPSLGVRGADRDQLNEQELTASSKGGAMVQSEAGTGGQSPGKSVTLSDLGC